MSNDKICENTILARFKINFRDCKTKENTKEYIDMWIITGKEALYNYIC